MYIIVYFQISAKYINPDLLHHSCVHMLQPSLIFSDRILAKYFPDENPGVMSPLTSPTDPTKSRVHNLGAMLQTNMAVVTYHSIQTFESFVKTRLHAKLASDVSVPSLSETTSRERLVCYVLFQVLNAVLSAHDGSSLYVIKTVDVTDILVVEHSVAEGSHYVIVNPLRSADFERLDEEMLCCDVTKLLCFVLDINFTVMRGELARLVPGTSRFAVGMRKMVEVLESGCFSALLVARSLMEYLLWGPSDKEMRSLLLAEDRQQAFCIWLEVLRCRYVNELALGQLERNLELSHMFHFLCAVTGANLLDVTKLLYKSK